MFKIREVKNVGYSTLYNCAVAIYVDNDGYEKFAACTENLYIRSGDKVEIYTDDFVSYKGFGAMVLNVIG